MEIYEICVLNLKISRNLDITLQIYAISKSRRMVLNVLYNNGRNISNTCHLNYFAQVGNLFIMDNHMAAIWCLEKLDREKQYSFLHIDAHYDLGGVPIQHEYYHDLDLKKIPVEDLMKYKSTYWMGENVPFFLWDNYIHLFADKFPNILNRYIFITQKKEGFDPVIAETEEQDIWHLKYMFQEYHQENWILNFDIDYFIDDENGKYTQIFTDNYIQEIGEWIKENHSKFHQIMIALSPECSGGWEQSLRVVNILLEPLKIKVEI